SYLHDSNKFEMRFVKGKYNWINPRGLKVEINSDTHVITADNGHGSSVVLSDSGIKAVAPRIDLN
ncbi:MAG: hypothetical protein LBH43_12985, partial [Treponema sp.]|nr:hypothetical protein [Treponema sp.]